jgi:hypothetical protein
VLFVDDYLRRREDGSLDAYLEARGFLDSSASGIRSRSTSETGGFFPFSWPTACQSCPPEWASSLALVAS